MILTELDGAALRVGALSESVLRLRAELDQPDVWTGPAGGRTPGADLAPASGLTVELRGLGKRYGERRVLEAIDLTIAPGEFVAIVGRSGCGKSTLLSASLPSAA